MEIDISSMTVEQLAELKKQLEEQEKKLARQRENDCIKEVLESVKKHGIRVERVVRLLAESIGLQVIGSNERGALAQPRFQKGLKYCDPVSGDLYITGGQGKPPAWFSAARQAGTLNSMLVSD
jgi:DNA-binding protein H-NS